MSRQIAAEDAKSPYVVQLERENDQLREDRQFLRGHPTAGGRVRGGALFGHVTIVLASCGLSNVSEVAAPITFGAAEWPRTGEAMDRAFHFWSFHLPRSNPG
jgi:hypothetical protein